MIAGGHRKVGERGLGPSNIVSDIWKKIGSLTVLVTFLSCLFPISK